MEENKDEGIVIADEKSSNPIEVIKNSVEKVGVKMPDLVATGDLTVNEEVVIVDDKPVKEVNKKDIPLPEMGTKFMFNGHEYKVIYINAGQHRFTCEPCKGVY